MSATVYRGLATLLHHGFEIVVHADLAIRSSPQGDQGWGGHLQADRDEDFELMAEVREGRVRLPDAVEAEFVGVTNELGSGGIEIAGRGAAPF